MCVGCHSASRRKNSSAVVAERTSKPSPLPINAMISPTVASSSRIRSRPDCAMPPQQYKGAE